jgi:hypothetical protein
MHMTVIRKEESEPLEDDVVRMARGLAYGLWLGALIWLAIGGAVALLI